MHSLPGSCRNNVRMALECVLVVAHAMGRTLVIPPPQHLYLLGAKHQDKHDKEAHDEMGFEDFFDLDLLQSHRGAPSTVSPLHHTSPYPATTTLPSYTALPPLPPSSLHLSCSQAST